jgi:signal transduction histidine kinase
MIGWMPGTAGPALPDFIGWSASTVLQRNPPFSVCHQVSTITLIGSIRRECLDHIVVTGEQHLRRILKCYMEYYNAVRTHLSLGKDAPIGRDIERAGLIEVRRVLSGLHHQYLRIWFAAGTRGHPTDASSLVRVMAMLSEERADNAPRIYICRDEVLLAEAINEVIVLARTAVAKNGVLVDTHLTEGALSVEADRVQLQQVVLNLILNAVEAMGSVQERPRELLISTEQDHTGVLVAVRDSGPSIDPENIERVFEAFHTTKSSGVGMGLWRLTGT